MKSINRPTAIFGVIVIILGLTFTEGTFMFLTLLAGVLMVIGAMFKEPGEDEGT